MKLFQIEEPDGTPLASDGPGVAVGIELSAASGAAVAVAVGGNAELLPGADGAARLAATALEDEGAVAALLLRLRERAEKTLARPVTHAVVALAEPGARARAATAAAAPAAGLVLLKVMGSSEAASRATGAQAADAPVLGAAIQAEDEAAQLAR
jgi:Ethanolamine utilization protein EutJ (predicted chaperonin)